MGPNQPQRQPVLRRASAAGQVPAWIPTPTEYTSFEVDVLWDRFGDRLATCVLTAHYEQRVELYDGTPMEHAIDSVKNFFRWFADEGHTHELDEGVPPFTKDDYERLSALDLEHLARRAFDHLHREATG